MIALDLESVTTGEVLIKSFALALFIDIMIMPNPAEDSRSLGAGLIRSQLSRRTGISRVPNINESSIL